MNNTTQNAGQDATHPTYTPALWEKIVAYVTAVFIVGITAFAILRDQPFQNPNTGLYLRILLSVAIAIVGAVIPGFIDVDLSGRGKRIRAGGALALFVISFFFSPKVLTSFSPEHRYVWADRAAGLNGSFERLMAPMPRSDSESENVRSLILREEELRKLQAAHSEVIGILKAQSLSALESPKQIIRLRLYEALLHYQVAAIASLRSQIKPGILPDEFNKLIELSVTHAEASASAASEGMEWCKSVLTYPASRNRAVNFEAESYSQAASWVAEGVQQDLIWYQTAAHVSLAYYGKYDLNTAREEVEKLTEIFPIHSADPPQKDGMMQWILASTSRLKISKPDANPRSSEMALLQVPVNVEKARSDVTFASARKDDFALSKASRASYAPNPDASLDTSSQVVGPDSGPCCR